MAREIELEQLKNKGWEENSIQKLDKGLKKHLSRMSGPTSESLEKIGVIVSVKPSSKVQNAMNEAISAKNKERNYSIEDLVKTSSRDKNLNDIFQDISSFMRSKGYTESDVELTPKKSWLTNSIKAELNAEQIREIAKNNNVIRIEKNTRLIPELSTSIKLIKVPQAQKLLDPNLTGNKIKVGIIDSEIDDTHEAFKGLIMEKRNHSDESLGNFGHHGTHVCGIISSNDDQYRGIAPKADIWNYKVFPFGTKFNGIEAIEEATEDGCKVINCSWGAEAEVDEYLDGTSALCTAIVNAGNLDVCIIKSAGNNGASGSSSTITIPADAKTDAMVVVGSCDPDLTGRSWFSSMGPTTDGRNVPHVLAPGEDITSTTLSGDFVSDTGTSMSAPHVTGIVALMLEANPDLRPKDIKDILRQTSKKISDSDENEVGKGIVDAENAIKTVTKYKNGGVIPYPDSEYTKLLLDAISADGMFKIKVFEKS